MPDGKELISRDLTDLDKIAEAIISFADDCKIWLFYGEMGSGKTTLIKHICKKMKIEDDITSPTFSIINEYQGQDESKAFHFDFYRIKSEAEAMDIGYEEYFYSGYYCFIEWPEKIPNLLPQEFLKIDINLLDGKSRVIHLSKPYE